jgi:aspartate racemase
MKMLGLIGAMSWESTLLYYRALNEGVRAARGRLHSASVLLRSVDFETIVKLQRAGEWDSAARILIEIATDLENSGSECVLICTNTMHKLAAEVQASINVPLLNIIDVTAEAIRSPGLRRPLLLATRYTMEDDFYVGRLREVHNLAAIVPGPDDRRRIHNIIFDELCRGEIKQVSREVCVEIVKAGEQAGADCVIFGCTEIGMLTNGKDFALPAFDSTLLHVEAALKFSLGPSLVCDERGDARSANEHACDDRWLTNLRTSARRGLFD